MSEWITPPTFTDGELLGASALNTLAYDIEYLKGRTDGGQSLFPAFSFDADDAYRMMFYKHAGMDYLYYWFYVLTGTADTVSLYISDWTTPGVWGSDYWSFSSLTSASGQQQGHTNISALTDNTWYLLSVDADMQSSSTLLLYRLALKSTNS